MAAAAEAHKIILPLEDQARLFEYAEMLGDGWTADGEGRRKLRNRRRPRGEVRKDRSPRGIGQRGEPHRADVAKMLVHRSARRRGLGARMLAVAEASALAAGKTLLVLDTVTGGDAERLYARCGWTRVGVVPDYALFPDGRYCDTTFFYKRLG